MRDQITYTPTEDVPEDFISGQPLYDRPALVPLVPDSLEQPSAARKKVPLLADTLEPGPNQAQPEPVVAQAQPDSSAPAPEGQGVVRNVIGSLRQGEQQGVYMGAKGTLNFLKNLSSPEQVAAQDKSMDDYAREFSEKGFTDNPLGRAWIGFGRKVRSAEKGVREWLESASETIEGAERIDAAKVTVDPEFAASTLGQVIKGVGQAGSSLAFWAIPGIGQIAGPVSAVGQVYQEAFDDASRVWLERNETENLGLTPEDIEQLAHEAGLVSLPAGALEVVGEKLIFGPVLRALKGKIKVGSVMQVLGRIGGAGAVEGSTEGAQQAWLNTIASKIAGYDPERELDDEVIQSIIVGGLVGLITGGLGEAMQIAGDKMEQVAATKPIRTEAMAQADQAEAGMEDANAAMTEAAAAEKEARRIAGGIGMKDGAIDVESIDMNDPDAVAEHQRQMGLETAEALTVGKEIEMTAAQAMEELERNTFQLQSVEEVFADPEVAQAEQIEQLTMEIEEGGPQSDEAQLELLEIATDGRANESIDQASQGMADLSGFVGKSPNQILAQVVADSVDPVTAVERKYPDAAAAQEAAGDRLAGQFLVEVENPDGTRQPALFAGYWQEGIPAVGHWLPEKGAFSHGMLRPGQQIVSRIPTFQEWGDLQEQAVSPTTPPAAEATPPIAPDGQSVPDNTQITIQQPQGDIPGYIQVDLVDDTQTDPTKRNIRSTNPATLAAEGLSLPVIPADIPQGRYTVAQIRQMTAERTAAGEEVQSLVSDEQGVIRPAQAIQTAVPTPDPGAARTVQTRPMTEDELSAEQMRKRGQKERAQQIARRLAKIGLPADQTPDLLNEIQDLGGVPAPSRNSGGEYDGFRDSFQGVARFLIVTDSNGSKYGRGGIDTWLQEFQEATGRQYDSIDEFYNAVFNAQARRKGVAQSVIQQRRRWKAEEEFDRKTEKFEGALLRNEKAQKRQSTRPINSQSLAIGDRFKVDGELFVVTGIDPDTGQVVIQDGITYMLADGVEIYPDKKTVRRVKRDTDFFAPEDQASLEAEREADNEGKVPLDRNSLETDSGLTTAVLFEGEGRDVEVSGARQFDIRDLARGVRPINELSIEEMMEVYKDPQFFGYDRMALDSRIRDLFTAADQSVQLRAVNAFHDAREEAARQEALDAIGNLEGVGAVRMDARTDPRMVDQGIHLIFSRSADPDQKPWRVTRIDNQGPSGHTEHATLEGAIDTYTGGRDPSDPGPSRGSAFEFVVTDVRRFRRPPAPPAPELTLEGQTDEEITLDQQAQEQDAQRAEQAEELTRRAEAPLAPRAQQIDVTQGEMFAQDSTLFSGESLEDQTAEPLNQEVAPLRYNPGTNRHNGTRLTPGDILTDSDGNRYRLDRDSGFILTLDRLNADGNPVGTISVSVDPTDTTRFRDLYQTGENARREQEETTPPPADPRDKEYQRLWNRGTPMTEDMVELTEKQVTTATRRKLQRRQDASGVTGMPMETANWKLTEKAEVTGNPSDRGWILRNKEVRRRGDMLREKGDDYSDSLQITDPTRRVEATNYVTAINTEIPSTDYPTETDEEALLTRGKITPTARARLSAGERLTSVLENLVNGIITSFDIVGTVIRSSEDFVKAQLAMRSPYQESVKIAFLDENNRVIHSEVASVGNLTSVTFGTQTLNAAYRRAQALGAQRPRVFISHNHPSGKVSPSEADIVGFQELNVWAFENDADIIDFVITNGDRFFSQTARRELPLSEPSRAAWEAAPTGQRLNIKDPQVYNGFVATLRQGNPDAEFIIYTDPRLAVTAVEQVPAGTTAAEWAATAQRGVQPTAASGVILVTNQTESKTRAIISRLQLQGVPVQDASSSTFGSWFEEGLLINARMAEEQMEGRLRDDQVEFGFDPPTQPTGSATPTPTQPTQTQTEPPPTPTPAPVTEQTEGVEPPGPPPDIATPTAPKGQGVRNLANRVISDENQPDDVRQKLADNPAIFYEKFSNQGLMEAAREANDQDLERMRNHEDRRVATHALIEQANRASARGEGPRAADLYAQAAEIFTDPAQLLNVAKAVRNPIGVVRMIEKVLAKTNRKMTDDQKTKVIEATRQLNEAEDALTAADQSAQKDFTPENERRYREARQKAGEKQGELRKIMQDLTPLTWTDMIVMTMQGNLLTPLSQATNIFGNLAWYGVRRSSKSLANSLDYIRSLIPGRRNEVGERQKRKRTIMDPIPLPSKLQLQAAADGVRTVAQELLSGPSAETYIRQEAMRGFRPLRAWAQAITGDMMPLRKDGSIALTDRLKKIWEGTFGLPAEVMFRLLSLGDRPFRRAAEMEILEESARLRELRGRDVQKAILFPDRATKQRLDTEGRQAIFVQDNLVSNILQNAENALEKGGRVGDAFKILGRIIAPYRQFPINFVQTALAFAAPEYGLARSLWRFRKGDTRGGTIALAESVIGGMIYGAASLLWQLGLISEPPDEDAKRRSIQYEQMGPNRLNISGLQRWLVGEDSEYRLGDRTIDYNKVGIPAAIFHIFTMGEARESAREIRKGVKSPDAPTAFSNYLQNRMQSFPGMGNFVMEQSFLAGTQSFLEALSESDPEAPATQRWMANVFRMISSIAIPNTVEAAARAYYDYIPELRGDTIGQTMENVWKYKTFQFDSEDNGDDRMLLKRDFWGEPIPRAPEGSNRWLRQMFDVTRTEARAKDPFKQKLIDLFQLTGDPAAYPKIPSRTAYFQGINARLTPTDYDDYQTIIGQERRQYVEPLLMSDQWDDQTFAAQLQILTAGYEKAASVARKDFFQRPEIYDRYFNPETLDVERLRSTTPRGRHELELARPEEAEPLTR